MPYKLDVIDDANPADRNISLYKGEPSLPILLSKLQKDGELTAGELSSLNRKLPGKTIKITDTENNKVFYLKDASEIDLIVSLNLHQYLNNLLKQQLANYYIRYGSCTYWVEGEREKFYRTTPLHIAARHNFKETIKVLLQYDHQDIISTLQDSHGNTAITLATDDDCKRLFTYENIKNEYIRIHDKLHTMDSYRLRKILLITSAAMILGLIIGALLVSFPPTGLILLVGTVGLNLAGGSIVFVSTAVSFFAGLIATRPTKKETERLTTVNDSLYKIWGEKGLELDQKEREEREKQQPSSAPLPIPAPEGSKIVHHSSPIGLNSTLNTSQSFNTGSSEKAEEVQEISEEKGKEIDHQGTGSNDSVHGTVDNKSPFQPG